MSHLSSSQLVQLREELLHQLRRLEKSMQVTTEAAATVELDQTTVGRLSRMDALQNQELTQSLQERERVRLALLQQALERMEAGSYGVCEGCGGAIPFERLHVFPEAAVCSSCGSPS